MGLWLSHNGRSYHVPLERSRCPFGCARAWFRCPGCGRRCAILYLRTGYFACRRCQALVYPSQRERFSWRAFRRRDRIIERLGGNGGLIPVVKPAGMWWRTFDRLQVLAREAELQGLLGGMQQFKSRQNSGRPAAGEGRGGGQVGRGKGSCAAGGECEEGRGHARPAAGLSRSPVGDLQIADPVVTTERRMKASQSLSGPRLPAIRLGRQETAWRVEGRTGQTSAWRSSFREG